MLLKDRLRQLFVLYEPDVQRVIADVLDLEQQHISFDQPRLKDPIDDIISNVAEKKPTRSVKTKAME